VLFALAFSEIAAFLPLGAVLGFAALFCKRWWTQQDNAMAAAIAASDKENVKCEERIARLTARHEREMDDLRSDFNRLRAVVQQLIPLVPPETQAQLWNVMWSRNDDQPNALTGGPTASTAAPPG
jgi:hypothetical protein